METNKQQFPTEEVTLPSKGLLYPKDSPLSKGVVEIKYMTAKEEDILTNQNYIQKGTVIDKLLQSLIITDFNYNDLLVGDKNAILIAARILGYGKDYEFEYNGEKIEVDLTTISDKPLNESISKSDKNEFSFKLPASNVKPVCTNLAISAEALVYLKALEATVHPVPAVHPVASEGSCILVPRNV